MATNMVWWLILGIIIGACLILGWKWNVIWPSNPTTLCSKLENSDLTLDSPCMNATVSGGNISISGKIINSYTFEASFVIKLLDQTGSVVASQPVLVNGDWTQPGKIPFTTTISHSLAPQNATLVFQNDNPSGLPANQKQIFVPIIIQ